MLRSVDWQLFRDVSGQVTDPGLKQDCLIFEDETGKLSRNVGKQLSTRAA